MSKFADRLFYLRTENKLTQDGLCEILREKYNLDTNKSMISRYEKGIHEPGFTFIDYTADYFGVTVDWLMGRSDNKYYSDNTQCNKIPVIEITNNEIQLPPKDNIVSYEYTSDDADFCLKVFEDNMSSIGMKVNDLAFIHKQNDLQNGQVGLFVLNDKPCIYRIFKENNYVMLKSDNTVYNPIILTKKDFKIVTIIGRVVSVKFSL
jgi:repressor LexA